MNVGLIGCGKIAQVHARCIMENGAHHIVGVCDSDRQRSRQFAERFGAEKSYSALDQLLEEGKPDIVHVLTPPRTHASVAMRAMQAGCHVLVEKPMAVSAEEANLMFATAKANRVRVCVDHDQLFEPVMLRAISELRDGSLGDIVNVESYYGFVYTHDPDRRWIEDLPGGVFQNLASHPIYLLLAFMGEPLEMHVSSLVTGLLGPETPDELRMLLRARKALGQLVLSLAIRPNLNYLRISGTKQILHVDLSSKMLRRERLRPLPKSLSRGLLNLETGSQVIGSTLSNAFKLMSGGIKSYHGIGNLIQAFYRSVELGGPAPVTEESALQVVKIFDRIQTQFLSENGFTS